MAICKNCGTENIIHMDITASVKCSGCGQAVDTDAVTLALVGSVYIDSHPSTCRDCGNEMVCVEDDVYECLNCYILVDITEMVEELVAA